MKSYINTLIVTVIISQLAISFAPSKESARKYVRFVCGVVVMLCLIRPISSAIKNVEELIGGIKSIKADRYDTELHQDKYFEPAAVIMSYVSGQYRIDQSKMKITFITDEADELVEQIHVYIKECDSEVQEKIEAELNKELSADVYVFVG